MAKDKGKQKRLAGFDDLIASRIGKVFTGVPFPKPDFICSHCM